MLRAFVTFVVLSSSSAAFADDAGASAWRGVKEWRGQLTVKVDDESSANNATIVTRSSLTATFGPLAFDASLSNDVSFVWQGKLSGAMAIDTTMSTSGARLQWKGSGALGPDAIIKLTVDLQKGTYEVHVFTAEISGTHIAEAMGHRTTQATTMAVGSFTKQYALPRGGPAKLQQKFKCSFADCCVEGAGGTGPQRAPIDVAFTLSPATKLEAVPGGPYTVERGQRVTLDGSASKGSITKYTWKVTPGRCPGASARAKEHDGTTWTFTALCAATATLTVTDGTTDRKTVPIAVTPRRSFATQFSEAPEKPLDSAMPKVQVSGK